VGNEVELAHFRVGDLDSGFVVLWDEVGSDSEAGFRFGGTDELEDLVDVGEGFASPVFADLAEEAVLDGIPLGSAGRLMADGNGEPQRSANGVLKRFPPGAGRGPLLPPPSARMNSSRAVGYRWHPSFTHH